MSAKHLSPAEKRRYLALRQDGETITAAAKILKRSRTTMWTYEGTLTPEERCEIPNPSKREPVGSPRPLPHDELCPEAQRALVDFEFFRLRYLGHVSSPWQVEAAERMVELLEGDGDDYVVLNCPPGAGKSTLFTCDIPLWAICRDRSVRIIVGHRTQSMANTYSGRLRQILTRRTPLKARERNMRMGLEVDAAATLTGDFGPFKPATNDDLWRREQFTVVQHDDVRTDEKESTVVAFGMDSGQLGWRADLIVWDDLASTKIRTPEAVENQREWFDDEAETRLEPGGVFVVVGQRLGSNDIYRHCLDKRGLTDEDLESGEDTSSGPPMYQHIKYRAHYAERCTNHHRPGDAKPYGGHTSTADGDCLLDPKRLTWKKLATLRKNKGKKFEVLYQQEDVDPDEVLVNPMWVTGGSDVESGEIFPGCWDKERRLCELPAGLDRTGLLSVVTADPSPTKFWAIEWIVYQPSTGFRFLMDLERRAMDAPDFLDWSEQGKCFSGVMESWQSRSHDLGAPISTWIVEQNAAQRFILQYDHFRRWQQRWGVQVIGHDTGRNKANAEYGLEASLQPIFRRGLIRLPGSTDGVTRTASLKLVDEATRYPDVSTDDTLMALWFFEYQMQRGNLAGADQASFPAAQDRPSWMRGAASRAGSIVLRGRAA